MLLQVEKILKFDNQMQDMSEYDLFQCARRELAEKIADKMITEDLVKIEIARSLDDDFGHLTKIKAMVRAYHPDA